MQKIPTKIDFADSEYRSCKANGTEFIIYLDSWDAKTLKLKFFQPIKIIFNGGETVDDLYEKGEEILVKSEYMLFYYLEIPQDFKTYFLLDISDNSIFEIVSKGVVVTKVSDNFWLVWYSHFNIDFDLIALVALLPAFES